MFCKSLIIFGLLAAFSVQSMEATRLDAHTVELRTLAEIIAKVKSLIEKVNVIVSEDVQLLLTTFEGFLDSMQVTKEKFLNQGLGAISDGLKKGIDFIVSKIEQATHLGVNIAKCTGGKQLVELATAQAGELSECVSKPIATETVMINMYLETYRGYVKSVAGLPDRFDACQKAPAALTCLKNMMTELTNNVNDLPATLKYIMNSVSTSVAGLDATLAACTSTISATFNSKVDAAIDEVSKCVDELMPKPTFRF